MAGSYGSKHSSCACRYARQRAVDLLEGGACTRTRRPSSGSPSSACTSSSREQGYLLDLAEERRHHEVYLSDARKVAPDKLKTIVRHPIKLADEA